MRKIVVPALILSSLGFYPPPAFAQESVRIRGMVANLAENTITVTPKAGDPAVVVLDGQWTVTGIAPIARSEIKQGAFIGATVAPDADGTMRALEVHVFPERLRGTSEGRQPWDLAPNSAMINATIEADVASNDGRTLILANKDDKVRIVVPPDVPVVTFVPGERADVTPGATVFIMARRMPDGTLHARGIQVGKGITPPM
jgi:hypothetical protein